MVIWGLHRRRKRGGGEGRANIRLLRYFNFSRRLQLNSPEIVVGLTPVHVCNVCYRLQGR